MLSSPDVNKRLQQQVIDDDAVDELANAESAVENEEAVVDQSGLFAEAARTELDAELGEELELGCEPCDLD